MLAQGTFERLIQGEPSSGILVGTVFVLIAVLAMLLPRKERKRIGSPLLLLGTHVLLLLLHVLVPGTESVSDGLRYASWFFLLAALVRTVFLLATGSVVARHFLRPLPTIFLDCVQAVVYAVLGILILSSAGVNTSSLVTSSALITAAVGLSMRDTLGNIFSGLAIQTERPFEVDDWIQFDEHDHHIGKVLEINWRATRVITLDKVEVIIPNHQLAEAPIRNFTKPETYSRRSVYVVTPYDVPPGLAQRIILEAVGDAWGVLRDPAPSVVTNAFTERGVEHWVRIFTTQFDHRDKVDGAVRNRIWYALHRHGIAIPGPIRTVELHEASPEAAALREEMREEERLEVLHYVDFLAGLPEDALHTLAAASQVRHYDEGELIIREGEEGSEFYIILSGEVRVSVNKGEGRPVELARLGPTKFFGEMACMTGEKRTATVTAARGCELLVIHKSAFAHVLETAPVLADQMSEVLASRKEEIDGRSAFQDGEDPSAEARRMDLIHRVRHFFGIS